MSNFHRNRKYIDYNDDYDFDDNFSFSKFNPKSKLRRSLDDLHDETSLAESKDKKTTYQIKVVTSDIKYAGSDANFFIQIFGNRVDTGKISLDKSKTHKNKFEQGQTDLFEVNALDVGAIKKIRFGHDNKNFGAGYHLKEIIIEDKEGNELLFPCDKWFDKKEGDCQIERDLFPVSLSNKNVNRSHRLDPKDSIIYKIHVTTSDLKLAGTDAKVFIQIYGAKYKTDKIELSSSKTHKNKFEQGKTDLFEINALDVGKIEKIKISHDNTGIGPGWHLKDIIIETPYNDKAIFPCNKWLDKKEDDGLIERVLYPYDAIKSFSTSKSHHFIGVELDYEVYVVTSDILRAGTDANVHLRIYGELAKSPIINLEKSKTHRNKFEQGNTDRFTVRNVYFGELYKIKIGHDSKGIGSSWHLKEVRIESIDVGKTWIFPCNRWLDKNKEDGLTEVELVPIQSKDIYSDEKQYKIEIFTGDEKKSGTDSNVFLSIFGEKGESSEFALTDSKTHMNKFERNHMDRFFVKSIDLGKLNAIRIRHDNSGLYPSWFLDRVEITDESNDGKMYIFKCGKWLSLKKDECKIEYILKEMSMEKDKTSNKVKRIRPKEISTKVKKPILRKLTFGGKQSLDGTFVNIFLKIFGDNMQSDEIKLKRSITHQYQFCRDQIDLFWFETNDDLGTIYAIELKCEECTKTANDLDLKKLQICDEEFLYEFNTNQLITIKDCFDQRYKIYYFLEKNAKFI